MLYGYYDIYKKISNIYKINISNKITINFLHKYLNKCENIYYEELEFLLNNINIYKYNDTQLNNLYESFYYKLLVNKCYYNRYQSNLSLTDNDIKTMKIFHNKFFIKNFLILDPKMDYLSIPMFLLLNYKVNKDLLEFFHNNSIYIINKTSIYHIIGQINFNLYNDNEILDIINFYFNNLTIPVNLKNSENMTPLGYLIYNQTIKLNVLLKFLEYESLYQTYYSSIEDDLYSNEYLYVLLKNQNITIEMIFELIEKKYIDPKKENEKGENIIMIFAQNIMNLDRNKNKETIDIYTLLLGYVDINHKDIYGNNIMSYLCLINNIDLLKELVPLFGLNLLNEPNNEGITPLFRLVKITEYLPNISNNHSYTVHNMSCNNIDFFSYLLDLNIPLKFIIKGNYEGNAYSKCILEYINTKTHAKKIIEKMYDYDKNSLFNFTSSENGDTIPMILLAKGLLVKDIYKIFENNIDYNKRNAYLYDIFLCACEFGSFGIVKKLFKKANLENKNDNEENCLLVTCYRKNNKEKELIIKFLLDNGININCVNKDNNSFYKLLHLYDTENNLIKNLIDTKYINTESEEFINFVITNQLTHFIESLNIKENIQEYTQNIDDCVICRDEISINDKFYLCNYNDIKHIYHKDCFDKWIKESNKSNCLLCTKLIYTYKGYYIKK